MTGDALSESGTEFGARVRRRLREEQVIWITTGDRDGTPQPNPVSFLFQDDDSILTYNMFNANRLTHVVDRPRVALHFDGDGAGSDIVVFTGTPSLPDDIPPPHENPAYLVKYGDSLLKASSSVEEFGKKFPVPAHRDHSNSRSMKGSVAWRPVLLPYRAAAALMQKECQP